MVYSDHSKLQNVAQLGLDPTCLIPSLVTGRNKESILVASSSALRLLSFSPGSSRATSRWL